MKILPVILGIIVAALVLLVLASAVVFMEAEHLTPLQALYFGVVTVATVGYGDIHPKTTVGMVACVIMILGGVGIFTGSIGLISNAILSSRDRQAATAKIDLLTEIFLRTIAIGLLERFTAANPHAEKLRAKLGPADSWSGKDFERARNDLEEADFALDLQTIHSPEWSSFLESQSQVFLLLMGHPAISEGLNLTSVLRRTYHLAIGLKSPEEGFSTDQAASVRRDLETVYRDLTLLWLNCMARMVKEFPPVARRLLSVNPFSKRTP